MRPLEGNEEFCNDPSESGLKTSAELIAWTGPNIPCLDLCTGDSIQKVVYDLALILCDISENVLDVTKLDFKCLIADGECAPDTLLETLQLMINKHCGLDFPDGGTAATSLPIVNLPVCLHYKNSEGDTITSLRLDLYAKYLADSMCKIIVDVKSLQSVVTNLTTQINTLNATLTGGGGSASGNPSASTITTKCLSASTPGQVIPLSTAFQNLETALCSYITTIGTSEQWTSLLDSQCITNTTLIPGSQDKYSSLPGWIADPVSARDSVSNLWKVVCKLNELTTNSASSGGSGCYPAAPSIILDSAKNLSWSSPAPSTYSQPLGYKVTVKNNTTNVQVHQNNSVDTTSYNLAPYLTDTTATYKIEVVASYTCGDSAAAVLLAAPTATSGGETVSGLKIKLDFAGSGIDIYSDAIDTGNTEKQSTPFSGSGGSQTCQCEPATSPKINFAIMNSAYDHMPNGVYTVYSTSTCDSSNLSSYMTNKYIPFNSMGGDNDFHPTDDISKFFQFRVGLLDNSNFTTTNTTAKPIVCKIAVKRAYWRTNVSSIPDSPSDYQDYIVNLIIPVGQSYSNYVKVYKVRGHDAARNCRAYNQCGFCYLGAYEGIGGELEGVFPKPTSLGTKLITVGIEPASFNSTVINMPTTSCV